MAASSPPVQEANSMSTKQIRCSDADEDYVMVSNLIHRKPLQALSLLAAVTSKCKVPDFPHHRNAKSMVSIMESLARAFHQLRPFFVSVRDDSPSAFPPPALDALRSAFDAICSVRSLLECCSNGSRIAMVLLSDVIAVDFRDAAEDLGEALASFPWEAFDSSSCFELRDRVEDVRRKCVEEIKVDADKADLELRAEVIIEVEEMERQVFVDDAKVDGLFGRLQIHDVDDRVREVMALETMVRRCPELELRAPGLKEITSYSKTVFFGDSIWPEGSGLYCRNPSTDWVFPAEVRCPRTGAVMRDPVAAIGRRRHAADKPKLERWVRNSNKIFALTLNYLLLMVDEGPVGSGLIESWAREQGVDLEPMQVVKPMMVASYLASKLTSSPSTRVTNRVLSKVIAVSTANPRVAVKLGEVGLLEWLLHGLQGCSGDQLQAICMETLHAVSAVEANKKKLMELEFGSGVNTVIDILNCTSHELTWNVRGHAAGTVYHLSKVGAYKWCLGREERVMGGLSRAAREGPVWVRAMALAAVLELGSCKDKLELVRSLLKQCDEGEAERVAEVVCKEPALGVLIREKKEMGGSTRERKKVRRKVRLLLEICLRWKKSWDEGLARLTNFNKAQSK